MNPAPAIASSVTPIEILLGRLDRPRKCGRGWIARCPAHEDRQASLSIAEGNDGRILLNCFGGCEAGDVVAAVGLTLGDLFPQRDLRDMSQAERNAMREGARQAQWRAALNVLVFEATVVHIVAAAVKRLEVPADEDMVRLETAIARIENARAIFTAR